MERQRVLLVGPDQEENLSLRYLGSSLVAAGHDVVIAPFNRAEEQPSVVAAADRATMVGLSLCFQARAVDFLELARALKEQAPARWIVAGGHYASCAAEELLAHHPEIDLVVVHEGEQTLVELADAERAGQLRERLPAIRGLVYREGGQPRRTAPREMIEDLDALPPPLRIGPARLLAGVPTAYLLGSRGCVGECSYCCITTLHRLVRGKRFRQRAPERIADEMAGLYHQRGVRQFIFHDDNFLTPSAEKNHRRLDALQAALDERDVRDIAITLKLRPKDAQAPLVRRLRDMGLIRVFLGVESASEAGLRCLNRRQTRDDAASALALCTELGVSAQYTMMIFHPAATLETCRADLDFMKEHLEYPLNFCRTEIYAGTPLEQQMIAEGRARGTYLGRSYTIPDDTVQWVSDASTRLFLARCWQGGGLMERAIGLDHLTAVMRRFYSPRRVERLARRILAWRREVNEDTLSLLEELFDIGARPGDRELALRGLSAREEESRVALHDRGLALFDELVELTLSLIGLDRPQSSARPLRRRLARHAAAALLAIGASSLGGCDCNGGMSEFAPPPVDARPEVRREIGQAEFAPPPVDAARREMRREIGQAEFAPPPVDAARREMRREFGMAEFAPPPIDAGRKQ